MAHCAPAGGPPLPGLSPVAMQQGRHVAKNIRIRAGRRLDRSVSSISTKARWPRSAGIAAVADAGFHALQRAFPRGSRGSSSTSSFSSSFRNKVQVLLSWAYAYLTYGRGARLITGQHWQPPAGKN